MQCGYPAGLRCGDGPDLACDATADWACERVGLAFIQPRQHWHNGYVESFNSRLRDECLNMNIFWSLAPDRAVITNWKDESTTADTACSATRPQRSTLPLAPTVERLSRRVDQYSGSGPCGHYSRTKGLGIRGACPTYAKGCSLTSEENTW
jgi:hypothetical protein